MYKINLRAWILIFALLALASATAFGQGTAFTYQGKLVDGGNAANGQYDFQLKLFDTVTVGTGAQQGSTITLTSVQVTAGIFAVQLDFGACPTCFDGSVRFLEIAVKKTSDATFTTLGPRQPVASNPYAIRSLNAAMADGLSVACVTCVTSSQIASLPSGSGNYIQNQNSTIQATANFNINGTGAADIFNAATQYNLGGNRVLSIVGSNNLFTGINTGTANTGGDNAFFGYNAGATNTTAFGNSFFGTRAGQANSSGASNSFFGSQAGRANTTGGGNSFFGENAGSTNTTGFENSFFGRVAGQLNTTGTRNSFFGSQAGESNTTGGSNAFFGTLTGLNSTTGSQNSFFGEEAGESNKAGTNNAFFGFQAGQLNGFNVTGREGTENSYFGSLAGIVTTSGNSNTMVGFFAGSTNTTGSNLTLIGAAANVGVDGLNFATAIGAGAVVSTNNTIALGRSNGADAVLVPGNLNVNGTLNANLPSGNGNYVQNQNASAQSANFNINGNGTAGGTLSGNIVNATTQYNIGITGFRVLSTSGGGFNDRNIFVGANAGQSNPTGLANAFFGRAAGFSNTSGNGNSFFGADSGTNLSSGTNNSFFGVSAAGLIATGNNNTAIGANTNVSNSLDHATAIGADAIVSASNTIALGRSNGADAVLVPGNLSVNGTLNANLPSGSTNYIQNQNASAQSANFSINGNGTAGGTLSGNIVNVATQYNIGGSRVLSNAGTANLFAGGNAGNANTSGGANSFFGTFAGQSNTSGSDNSFFGEGAGSVNSAGASNSFFGFHAGVANTVDNNSFFGVSAGSANSTGPNNSFFGARAGNTNTTGDHNSAIGADADVGSGNLTNSTAIGARAQVTASNSLVLGAINGTNGATADTNVGIGTTAPNTSLHIAVNSGQLLLGDQGCSAGLVGIGFAPTASGCTNYSLLGDGQTTFVNRPTGKTIEFREGNATSQVIINAGGAVTLNTLNGPATMATSLCRDNSTHVIVSCSSSLRYKTDIKPFVGGFEIIKQLRPISFNWKGGGARDLGFGAEDVAKVEPLLTFNNDRGEIEGVKYDRISVLLVNAVREQQTQIEQQQAQIKTQQAVINQQQTQAKQQEAQLAQQRAAMERQQAEIDGITRLVCASHSRAAICKRRQSSGTLK